MIEIERLRELQRPTRQDCVEAQISARYTEISASPWMSGHKSNQVIKEQIWTQFHAIVCAENQTDVESPSFFLF